MSFNNAREKPQMSGMGIWPADLIIPAILSALWIMTEEYAPPLKELTPFYGMVLLEASDRSGSLVPPPPFPLLHQWEVKTHNLWETALVEEFLAF